MVTELPRSGLLEELYCKLEALLLAFELYVVYDEKGELIEVQILSNADTEPRIDALDKLDTTLDTALTGLLTDHSPFVVVHAGPLGSRLHEPPRAWLESLETDPIELFAPQEIPLGSGIGLNLSGWCLTQRTHQYRSCARPTGYVLSGPSLLTRMIILPWLLSPSQVPPDSEPSLIASHSSLVVVPESRVHLWKEHLMPDVLVIDESSLGSLNFSDLLHHAYIVATREALVHHALEIAHSLSNATSFVRSHGMALVRRVRTSTVPLCEIPLCFHAVHFRRLVVDDVSYDLGSVSNTLSAQTRIGLSEDGRFFADRSYLSFTGLHPDLTKFEITGCVHRSLETIVCPKAFLHTFAAPAVRVGPVPAAQLMSLILSTPSFLSPLTADALSQFTEYGKEQVRKSHTECPICFTKKSRAFMPCGHSFCFECSERLPVESISMAIHRTPVVIRQCLIRRCPICRSRCQHIYSKRVRAHSRQRLVAKLVRGATTKEVWVCSHWSAALDELIRFVQSDTKNVVMRRIDQTAMFPASGDDVTVVWAHPPCFFNPNLDMLNMLRAYNAVGQRYRNLHVVCADATPEISVLQERFAHVSKRSIVPRE